MGTKKRAADARSKAEALLTGAASFWIPSVGPHSKQPWTRRRVRIRV